MDRTCDVCGKVFDFPARLVRHKSGKRACGKETNVYECKYCGRSFDRGWNLKRHLASKCRNYVEREEIAKTIVLMNSQKDNQMVIKGNNNVITTVNGDNNHIENISGDKIEVHIHPFGKEDLACVTPQLIVDVSSRVREATVFASELAREIFHKVPSNRNAYLQKNTKDSVVMVYEDKDAWMPYAQSEVYIKIINKVVDAYIRAWGELRYSEFRPSEAKMMVIDQIYDELMSLSPDKGVTREALSGMKDMLRGVLLANKITIEK